ncbi:AAA ATPase domain-containing protein [Heterostelium album PN500]|uniref:AAA ATPase domain-containing protein n=1 Tax=Heterostelium pallidum (strain ATCC 26659 / Pp 5 / PN500) TaxID=670386 RepID=D3BLY0_HETP5|nr:AAA ATPase domain-containing protein [Heterostelium album PN500]EFA77581.1 AAA ATPase domain-containing protein [Heterostelium album PN500]|eukprot:XP_020429709.1 AAA ATPase domain-containing protein [Heterostelium album PN500]
MDVKNLLASFISVAFAAAASTLIINYYFERENNEKRKLLSERLSGHPLGSSLSRLDLNQHEIEVLACLINPRDIASTFDDIGGLDDIIQDVKDTIFLPLEQHESVDMSQFTLPKGILLYGPPGTGKTMLAKAIAKESGYFFLNINDSLIESKFYGETGKLLTAIFTLAEKLQPVIVFFDEIDGIVGTRSATTTDYNISKKSVLLQLWDGIKDSKIIIIGATNRINAIDEAFLRRMPKRIRINLPDVTSRENILRKMLKDRHDPNFDFKLLAQKTQGYSGSDLQNLTSEALNLALRSAIKSKERIEIRVTHEHINRVVQNQIKNNSHIQTETVVAND